VLAERPSPASLTGGALIFGALAVNTALDLMRPRQPSRTHVDRTNEAAIS